MDDNQFWELVDKYERKDISIKDAIKEICAHAKTYEVAMADLELLIKRTISKEEKNYVKELLNDKVNRRSSQYSKK